MKDNQQTVIINFIQNVRYRLCSRWLDVIVQTYTQDDPSVPNKAGAGTRPQQEEGGVALGHHIGRSRQELLQTKHTS